MCTASLCFSHVRLINIKPITSSFWFCSKLKFFINRKLYYNMYKAPLVGLPHRLQVKPTWFSSKRPTARMKLKFFASPVPPDVTVLNGVGVLGVAWSGEDVLTRHHVERWKRGGGGGYEMQWLRRRGGVARAGRRRGAHRWPAASPEAGSPPPAIRCCPPPFSFPPQTSFSYLRRSVLPLASAPPA